MRQWIGSTVLALVGIGIGLAALVSSWPIAWPITIAIVTIVAVVLTWPSSIRRAAAPPPARQTATIRGDVSGSTITDVWSNADSLVDGNVRESILERLVHRPRNK